MKNLSETEILERLFAKRKNFKVTHEEVINPDYELWGRAREWHYHQGICLCAGLAPNLIEVITKFGPHPSLNLPSTFCSLEINPSTLENLKKLKERKNTPVALNSVVKEDSQPQTLPVPPEPST
jgi:hypothetical protein